MDKLYSSFKNKGYLTLVVFFLPQSRFTTTQLDLFSLCYEILCQICQSHSPSVQVWDSWESGTLPFHSQVPRVERAWPVAGICWMNAWLQIWMQGEDSKVPIYWARNPLFKSKILKQNLKIHMATLKFK